KYTAGLARSFVSGYSRSPAPPARRMTRTSSRSIDYRAAPEPRDGRGIDAAHGEPSRLEEADDSTRAGTSRAPRVACATRPCAAAADARGRAGVRRYTR